MEVSRGSGKWVILRFNKQLSRQWLHDKSRRNKGTITEHYSRLKEQQMDRRKNSSYHY